MKKTNFTFWLLGLGCGITLTGMFATFIALNVTTGQLDQPVLSAESQLKVKEQAETDSIKEADKGKAEEKQEWNEASKKEEQNPEEPVYIEITIQKEQGAQEICRLLEEAGLVDRADNFLSYVCVRSKQRYLKHGRLVLQQGLSYEELLEELTI